MIAWLDAIAKENPAPMGVLDARLSSPLLP
jgi:hypothetical protein